MMSIVLIGGNRVPFMKLFFSSLQKMVKNILEWFYMFDENGHLKLYMGHLENKKNPNKFRFVTWWLWLLLGIVKKEEFRSVIGPMSYR